MVEVIANYLGGDILHAADHQALSPVLPEAASKLIERVRRNRGFRQLSPVRLAAGGFLDALCQLIQEQANLAWRHRAAQVGLASGQGHAGFKLRMVGEPRRGRLQGSPARMSGGKFHWRDPRSKKIGIETRDHFGAVKLISRQHAHAVGAFMSVENGGG